MAHGHEQDHIDAGDGGPQRMAHVVREIAGCQSALYAYVCSLLGTSAGAADVLQDANVVLWEKAEEYDPARPFLPWAYRVAHFQVMAYRKRQSRDRLVFDDELLAAVDGAIRQRDERADRELEALDGCVGKLPARQRAVLDARYRDGEAVEAIAGREGKAPNALSAELYRLRKALMDCIRRALAAGGAQ